MPDICCFSGVVCSIAGCCFQQPELTGFNAHHVQISSRSPDFGTYPGDISSSPDEAYSRVLQLSEEFSTEKNVSA